MPDWKIAPAKATDAMAQAAFDEMGSPSDWGGFDAPYAAAIGVAPRCEMAQHISEHMQQALNHLQAWCADEEGRLGTGVVFSAKLHLESALRRYMALLGDEFKDYFDAPLLPPEA